MGKEPACNPGDTGDTGLIPGLGRPPGGGHSNPLQYSCLENPMDREAWWLQSICCRESSDTATAIEHTDSTSVTQVFLCVGLPWCLRC